MHPLPVTIIIGLLPFLRSQRTVPTCTQHLPTPHDDHPQPPTNRYAASLQLSPEQTKESETVFISLPPQPASPCRDPLIRCVGLPLLPLPGLCMHVCTYPLPLSPFLPKVQYSTLIRPKPALNPQSASTHADRGSRYRYSITNQFYCSYIPLGSIGSRSANSPDACISISPSRRALYSRVYVFYACRGGGAGVAHTAAADSRQV